MTEISKEYGTALFMVACEEGEQKEYAGYLKEIKNLFDENPAFFELLSSPSIQLSERLVAIDNVFGKVLPEYLLSYLKLLCEKGRIECFLESVEEYNALLNASERVFNAKVTSAQELTEEEKAKLIEKLGKSYKGSIQAEYVIDGALIGGVIVEIDGRVMDGSIRHRLQQVKEVINK